MDIHPLLNGVMSVEIISRAGVFTKLQIPYLFEHVQAGFPSPSQDFVERSLDLTELCIKHPAAIYFVRAKGDSMSGAGINDNDILVVDRSLEAKHGDIVIAGWDGELTVDNDGWKMKRERLSPAYTTRWQDIPLVK